MEGDKIQNRPPEGSSASQSTILDQKESNTGEVPVDVDPLLVPEILEALMNNMEYKQLWTARGVCKQWNDEAIRSIEKRIEAKKSKSNPVVNTLMLPLSRRDIPLYKKWQETFKNSNAQGLDLFWSNTSVFVAELKDLFKGTSKPDGKFWILLKYGSYVKALNILPPHNSNVHLGNLLRLLTKVCPNVEELMIGNPLQLRDETAFQFGENQMLKLKNLHFLISINNTHGKDSINEQSFQILKTLLYHSPALTSISLEFHVSSFWNRFFAALSTKPEVALNLKEINVTGNVLDVLHLFSETQFGPNLTKVKLHHNVQRLQFPHVILNQLKPFMENVGIHLIHLEFKYTKLFEEYGYGLEALEHDPLLMIEDSQVNDIFPEMPLLKTFSTFFSFESFQFLERMPNLIKLCLTKIKNAEEILARPCPNNKIVELTSLDKPNYQGGGGFVFHGILSSDKIKNINIAFPNLTDFYLELIPPKVLTNYGLSLWFADVCKEISLMQNLKGLYMLMLPSDYFGKDPWKWYSQVELENGFKYLKNTPKLESLTLAHALIRPNGAINNDGRDLPFPRDPLYQLVEAPRLTRVKLSGLMVADPFTEDFQEIYETTELFRAFDGRGIKLHMVKNNHYLKWMRDY